MGVDLDVKPVESLLQINRIVIEIRRDNADVTMVVDVLNDSGGAMRQESKRHPDPVTFLKSFVPAPKDIFDNLDAVLAGIYGGTTTPNTDVTF